MKIFIHLDVYLYPIHFLGFLGSRAKTVDNRTAWQKSLIFTEKEEKEKKQTSRPIHVCIFLKI